MVNIHKVRLCHTNTYNRMVHWGSVYLLFSILHDLSLWWYRSNSKLCICFLISYVAGSLSHMCNMWYNIYILSCAYIQLKKILDTIILISVHIHLRTHTDGVGVVVAYNTVEYFTWQYLWGEKGKKHPLCCGWIIIIPYNFARLVHICESHILE